MHKITILSGAGISQESGISTFRDANGLWENHDIMDVASIQGWNRNPALVQDFYNQRRAQLAKVKPNLAHQLIADLQTKYDVSIVTQNVDDLHERAGSINVIHLHGELYKACNESKTEIYHWENDITANDKAKDGSRLRPFIVWFGEDVPMMNLAMEHVYDADILIVIGTSLQVYPAANLIHVAHTAKKKFIIDPNCNDYDVPKGFTRLAMKATAGVQEIVNKHLK